MVTRKQRESNIHIPTYGRVRHIDLALTVFVPFLLLFVGHDAFAARQCNNNSDCNGGYCGFAGSADPSDPGSPLVRRFCEVVACSQDSQCDPGDICDAGICTGSLCNSVATARTGPVITCSNQAACVPNSLTRNECYTSNSRRVCVTSECRPLTCTQDSDCGSGRRCNQLGASGICDVTEFLSPVLGSTGGNSFTRTCNANEVMVGVRVHAGSWLDSIAPRCVSVTNAGAWTGAVRTLAPAGGGGGSLVTLDCPRDHAISGFSGRAGTLVDQLRLECRRLVSRNALQIEGAPRRTGRVGGTGGKAFGPFHCPGHLPVTAMRGRSGSYVDQVRLLCGR